MTWGNRPSLDGTRTIAVYLVLLFHSGLSAFGGGYIGVDLFFVLSGFLLTNVILNDVAEHGRLRFGWFYSRRVRRLLPAALIAVVAISVTFLTVASVVRRLPLVGDAQSALLYVANWRFLGEQNDYFATNVDKSPFLHFWSLSIEEQFYVVYPALLLLLTKLGGKRGSRRPLVVGLGVLCAASLALQVYWARIDVNHAYYGTETRVYQLLAGALLAVVLMSRGDAGYGRLARSATIPGLALLLLLGSGVIDFSPSWRGIGAAVASVVLITGLMARDDDPVSRVLTRRTPVYLGRISYGTYLWHWPVIVVLTQLLDMSPLQVAIASAVLATALAALSYEILEMPIRRAPSLNRFAWPAVVVGVTASAVVAVTLVPPILQSDAKPRVVVASGAGSLSALTNGAAWVDDPVPAGIDWQALSLDRGVEGSCTADDVEQCVVVQGSGPSIALVGDSHARVVEPVFAELAREHGWTLSISILESCPWQAGVRITTQTAAEQAECHADRDVWYRDVMPQLDPDIVFVTGEHRDDRRTTQAELTTGPTPDSLDQLWVTATRDTADIITGEGARLVMFDDMLETVDGSDPLDCLASASVLGQCAVPIWLQSPVMDAIQRTIAAESDDIYTVDINPIICPSSPVCAPMIDGINVWRNENHFSTTILLHFQQQVYDALIATGAFEGL